MEEHKVTILDRQRLNVWCMHVATSLCNTYHRGLARGGLRGSEESLSWRIVIYMDISKPNPMIS
jgi:hypothetical protein